MKICSIKYLVKYVTENYPSNKYKGWFCEEMVLQNREVEMLNKENVVSKAHWRPIVDFFRINRIADCYFNIMHF